MARAFRGALILLGACLLAATAAAAATPAWTTYRHDMLRTGVDPDSMASPLTPTQAWQTTPALDGQIFAQPLIYGARVYVVTENNSIYALDASTGNVAWHTNVGTPVVKGGAGQSCGNIDPVGITSTPVIDPILDRLFVVAEVWDGSTTATIKHELFAFDLASHAIAPGFPVVVDPPGSTPGDQLQRASLALDNGNVVIPFGGNWGDCGGYHGWLVAASENAGGSLLTYEVEAGSGHHGGAIWGAGTGPAVDSSGNIWVATGNGSPLPSTAYDGQESVLKLKPNLSLSDYWAPANWAALDMGDIDLGSGEPLLLPDGTVFQIGKNGTGYLLTGSALGHDGAAPLFLASVCDAQSKGGAVYYHGVLYVACDHGLRALSLNSATHSFAPLSGWSVTAGAIGPPIVAGGLVWSAGYDNGTLYGLDPATGAQTFSTSLTHFSHFTTPSAAGGKLFVANGNQVTAFTIATAPLSTTATTSVLTSSANPSNAGSRVAFTSTISPKPDGGTVTFTADGTPIAGCGSVPVSSTTGTARCAVSFARSGTFAIIASFSGDTTFAASTSETLSQVVQITAPQISAPSAGLAGRHEVVGLTLSERATVTVTVTRTVLVRRVGNRCPPKARRGHRCAVTVTVLKLGVVESKGAHKLPLPTLRPGTYTVTLIASSAGKRSTPRTLKLVVPRRKRR